MLQETCKNMVYNIKTEHITATTATTNTTTTTTS